MRAEWDGREKHAAWHKETSATIYSLGSAVRSMIEAYGEGKPDASG
jgi:hypothetical protein